MHVLRGTVSRAGRSLGEKKAVPEHGFFKAAACSSYVPPWLGAIGSWRLMEMAGWRFPVGGGWRQLAVGDAHVLG